MNCALAAGSCLLNASCAQLPLQAGGTFPLILTDRQLDRITAAAGNGLTLELSAFARGASASTFVAGSVTSTPAQFPLIEINSHAPEGARARLVGVGTGDLVLATGIASANGDSAAHCSATVAPEGNPTFIAQAVTKTTSPTSAICSCIGLAITLPIAAR